MDDVKHPTREFAFDEEVLLFGGDDHAERSLARQRFEGVGNEGGTQRDDGEVGRSGQVVDARVAGVIADVTVLRVDGPDGASVAALRDRLPDEKAPALRTIARPDDGD